MAETVSIKDLGVWMQLMLEAGTLRQPAIKIAIGILRQEEERCRQQRVLLEESPDAFKSLWEFAQLTSTGEKE